MVLYDRPVQENWKHTEVITLLAKLRDPAEPLLLASILSAHPFFFARTLTWSAFRQGVPLRQVSPGDSDASFLEFLIKKSGYEGTEAHVIDGQWEDIHPESRAFKELFPIVGRFPMPDNTLVTVYRRDPHLRFHVSPLTRPELERRIALALQHWVQGSLTVSIEATPARLQEGRLDRVRISCGPCWIKGLQVQKAEVIAEKPWLNMYRLWDENRLGLLGFESLKPSLAVTAADIQTRLSDVKGLRDLDVQLADDKIRLHGRFCGIPLGVVAHAVVDNSRYARLEAVVDRISLGGIPFPGWVLGKAYRQPLWLYPIPNFPGRIVVNQVTIDHGILRIS